MGLGKKNGMLHIMMLLGLQKFTFLESRGCARRGHGLIGAHFAKVTPNFGFLAGFGVIHVPLFLSLGNS